MAAFGHFLAAQTFSIPYFLFLWSISATFNHVSPPSLPLYHPSLQDPQRAGQPFNEDDPCHALDRLLHQQTPFTRVIHVSAWKSRAGSSCSRCGCSRSQGDHLAARVLLLTQQHSAATATAAISTTSHAAPLQLQVCDVLFQHSTPLLSLHVMMAGLHDLLLRV